MPTLSEPQAMQPPGTRRRKAVQLIECSVVVCWILTASSGCFGFYLGFDTKDSGVGPMLCKRDGDQCAVSGGHQAVCNECHRSRFDPVMVLVSFYQVVLGLVGLLVSCGSKVVIDRFGFLRNRFGRGFFLFFIGTFGIANGLNFTFTTPLTLIVGIIDTTVGAFLMLSYVCVSSGRVYEVPSFSAAVSNGEQRPVPALHDARDALITVAPR